MIISSIRNYWHDDSQTATKRRLFLLFLLNLSDWICTLSLLRTGLFKEANPLMRTVIDNIALGFVVKVAVPFALILFAVSKLEESDAHQILISNNIALVGVAVYFLLNIYHVVCFSMIQFILR